MLSDKERNKVNTTIIILREYFKKYFPDFPNSCCFESSLILEKLLNKYDIPIKTVVGAIDGIEHYFNIVNGNIFVDITANQFMLSFGIVDDISKYNMLSIYSLDDDLFELEEEEYYDELVEVRDNINLISKKCNIYIKKVSNYGC